MSSSSELSKFSGHDIVRAMALAGYTYLGERRGGALLVKDGVELLVPRRAELEDAELRELATRAGVSLVELLEVLAGAGVGASSRGRDSVRRIPVTQV